MAARFDLKRNSRASNLANCLKVLGFSCMVMVTLGFTSGCSIGAGREGTKLSSLRAADPALKTVDLPLSRAKYAEALKNLDAIARIRIIQIYHRNQEYGGYIPPEYRLFGIAPGSVYDQLGLKDGDILVSANGFVVAQPELFRSYVKLLGSESKAEIELRRGGEPFLHRYSFVD